MNINVRWLYDEFRQVGTDYGLPDEVAAYDQSHADFRDLERESENVLDVLGIKAGDVILDFGAGTGVFAVQAARRRARIHAVDVSQAMLEHARAKAAKAGLGDIAFHHAGFLTYEHQGPQADAIVTTFAFHHLPDFWKGPALLRLHAMLKSGGLLYLHDVILEEERALENIAALVDKLSLAGGERLRTDTERHFKEEFSTYDWVMDGLLQRAGFLIKSKEIRDGVLGTYLCLKPRDAA